MGEFLEQANGQIPNLKGIKYTSSDLAGGHAALRAANGKYTIIIGGEAVSRSLKTCFTLELDIISRFF